MLDKKLCACGWCACLMATGCIETIVHPPSEPRPDVDEPAAVVEETRVGEPKTSIEQGEEGVEVRVVRPTMCRTTSVQPAVEDHVVERQLTAAGWIGQGLLATTAAGAGVAGGYLVSAPCTLGSAAGAPCIGPVADVGTGVGAGAIVVSGLLTVALLGQALGTIDGTDTEAAPPMRTPGKWRVCSTEPLVGADVELWFSDGYVAGAKTNGEGKAYFAWSSVPASRVYVSYPKARVRLAEKDVALIGFRKSDLFRRAESADDQFRALAAAPPVPVPASPSPDPALAVQPLADLAPQRVPDPK